MVGSFGPLSSLDRVANRHRSRGIRHLEIADVKVRHILHLLNDLSRFPVASTLQIGVHQIIHCMQFFSRVALLVCRFPRGKVGSDRVLPQTESRKDVRWHVQGVWG